MVNPDKPSKRVEVRIDGRALFVNQCYDVDLSVADDVLKLTAALHPTLVDVAATPSDLKPERFEDDPRNGDEVIQKVHTGSRRRKSATDEVAAPSPKGD